MIRIEGISKAFGRTRALRDVSFSAESGDLLAVVGANGAGKTTLLRCLAGALLPQFGRIFYGEEPLDRRNLPLRRKFFFVPDAPFLYPDWSILKHLSMILRLYQREEEEKQEEAIRLLEGFELLEEVEVQAQLLSRGQLYKAALCGALLSGAPYLLLDEPFGSGIDPPGIAFLKRELRARAAAGHTVVYTTQLLDVAEDLSTRVCLLEKGFAEACAPLPELRAKAGSESGRLEEIFQNLRERALCYYSAESWFSA